MYSSVVPSLSERTTWLSQSLSYSVRGFMATAAREKVIIAQQQCRCQMEKHETIRCSFSAEASEVLPVRFDQRRDATRNVSRKAVDPVRLRRPEPRDLALGKLARRGDGALA